MGYAVKRWNQMILFKVQTESIKGQDWMIARYVTTPTSPTKYLFTKECHILFTEHR